MCHRLLPIPRRVSTTPPLLIPLSSVTHHSRVYSHPESNIHRIGVRALRLWPTGPPRERHRYHMAPEVYKSDRVIECIREFHPHSCQFFCGCRFPSDFDSQVYLVDVYGVHRNRPKVAGFRLTENTKSSADRGQWNESGQIVPSIHVGWAFFSRTSGAYPARCDHLLSRRQ